MIRKREMLYQQINVGVIIYIYNCFKKETSSKCVCLSHAKYLRTNVLPYSETRQRGRFAGFSLYISDTDVSKTDDIQKTILCYKDGPLLPPLNFTTICKAYGRYVIFYNERKQVEGDYPNDYEVANVFTELCEVMVQGNISKIRVIYLKTQQISNAE